MIIDVSCYSLWNKIEILPGIVKTGGQNGTFSCRFEILSASCKRELIFQSGMKFSRFQILPASCKRGLNFINAVHIENVKAMVGMDH